jgi:hypothetical protein
MDDGIVLRDTSGKVQVFADTPDVTLPELPPLMTVPTLRWLVQSEVSGEIRGQLSYLTRGLNWNASYNAFLDESETKMDLTSWVTIVNQTGLNFQNVRINLIAGQLQRVEPEIDFANAALGVRSQESKAAAPFETPQNAFEYHQYALKRSANLKDSQRTQLSFYGANAVPVTKRYVLDSGRDTKVWVMFDLTNTAKDNLGIPLPAGLVRVYKRSSTGVQLIGEDRIEHWAKGEKVTLTLGVAFDIKAERRMIAHQVVRVDERSREVYRDTVEITLRNHKEQASQVEVIAHLPGVAKIIDKSMDLERLDANRILFKVLVPKEGEAKINYTVEYTY